MEKILIISTGGTIVSAESGTGARPNAETSRSVVAPLLEFLAARGIDYEIINLFGDSGIDSSDISQAEWLELSRAVTRAAQNGIKKILILHGTDTMAYSAAWLSLTTQGAAVVLTGSQRTPDEAGFDGRENLLGAAEFLLGAESGVFIYFAGEPFPGAFVHKEDASALSAYVRTGCGETPSLGLPARISEAEAAACGLAVVYLYPAYAGGFPKNVKVLVLCGYGAGNMASRLHGELESSYADGERPILIAASSCAKGEKNPSRYGGVGVAALAAKKFTVFGQGGYSLEFIVALSYFALLNGEENAEKILGRYLEKF